MNQNIFYNILLLFVILYIIKEMSPERDSLLYILKKYINYFIFQFKYLIGMADVESFILTTFKGIPEFGDKAPSFKTAYAANYIEYHKLKEPNVSEKDILKHYNFLQSLVSINTDSMFHVPSDIIENSFTTEEIEKIKNILLKKLNSKNLEFKNLTIDYNPKYLVNVSGKEVNPFIFFVETKIGKMKIYINIDIRKDIYQNKEYVVINEIRPLMESVKVPKPKKNEETCKSEEKNFDGDVDMIFY
jgi:hypothetical protein